MNIKPRLSKVPVVALALLVSWSGQVTAGIIASSDLGTIVSDPDTTAMDPIHPMDDPLTEYTYDAPDGKILFEDKHGNGLAMRSEEDADWWAGGGPIFTTPTDTMVVSFEGMDVFGFSFNLGANQNAIGWIEAYFSDTSGEQRTARADNLSISPGNSPGFGVFASSSGGSCSTISKVVIDPTFEWGIGNMAIDTGSCVSVPEPGPLGLLGLGLLGLGMARIRKSHPAAV